MDCVLDNFVLSMQQARSWPAHRLSRETTANEENRGYYIEWPALEIDLSADTLWHEGKLSY